MIGPDDQTDLQYQARGCGHGKVKRTTGQVQLEDLDHILREKLRWFGHVERSSGLIRTACDIQIEGRQGAWKKLTEKGCSEWKLTTVDPQERSTRRSEASSIMRALSGARCTDVRLYTL